MHRFNVTYDVVTPESAEHGDTAERGFLDSDGRHVPMDGICGQEAAAIKANCAMTLRQAVRLIGYLDSWCGGPSFYESDGCTDYQTGAVTTNALHCPDTITSASLHRVASLLGAVNINGERHRYHAATFA